MSCVKTKSCGAGRDALAENAGSEGGDRHRPVRPGAGPDHRDGARLRAGGHGPPARPGDPRGAQCHDPGAFARSVEHIVGVQFRNCATVGAASLAASASPTCSPCCWPWTPGWCSRGRGTEPGGVLRPSALPGHPWSGSSFPRERRGRSICPSGTAPQTFPSSPAPSPAGRARSASPSGPGRGGPGSIWMRRGCCLAGSPGTAPWPWGRICPAGSPWGQPACRGGVPDKDLPGPGAPGPAEAGGGALIWRSI